MTGATVHTPGYNLYEHAQEEGLFGDARTVLFQADHVTVSARSMLGERFEGIEWQPVTRLVTEHVGSKAGGEIAKIRAAQAITDEVFTYLLDFIEPGMTEKDVAAEIIYQHLKRGAETMSFDPIVAGGPNGSLPHARPSSRPWPRANSW